MLRDFGINEGKHGPHAVNALHRLAVQAVLRGWSLGLADARRIYKEECERIETATAP